MALEYQEVMFDCLKDPYLTKLLDIARSLPVQRKDMQGYSFERLQCHLTKSFAERASPMDDVAALVILGREQGNLGFKVSQTMNQ